MTKHIPPPSSGNASFDLVPTPAGILAFCSPVRPSIMATLTNAQQQSLLI